MQPKKRFTLNDLDKRQIFSVPDDYFEQLPTQISGRVTDKAEKRGFFSVGRVKYGVSLAGVLLVLLAGYLFYSQPDTSTPFQPETALADVSDEEIMEYLEQADLAQAELIEIASQANALPESSLPDEIDAATIQNEVDSALLEEYL